MKYFYLIVFICATFFGIPGSAKPSSTPHSHILRMEATPIENVDTAPGSVWDLSHVSRIDRRPPVCVNYGDTLLSETVDGERRWYTVSRDSAFLIKEESRLCRHDLAPGLPTAATGLPHLAGAAPYRTAGMHSHTFPAFREGSYRSWEPVRGRLVTSQGDTIEAAMTREECGYVERHLAGVDVPDTIVADDAMSHHSFIRYRWFTHGDVAVAVQTEYSSGEKGEVRKSAYIMDYSPFSSELCERESHDDMESDPDSAIASALSAAAVTAHDGHIAVNIDTPCAIEVALDIMSDAGVSELHATFIADGETYVEIPCHSLPAGRHVASLSAMSHSEKSFIHIN